LNKSNSIGSLIISAPRARPARLHRTADRQASALLGIASPAATHPKEYTILHTSHASLRAWRDGADPAKRPEQEGGAHRVRPHERGDGGGSVTEARCVRDAQCPFQQRREHNPAAQSGRSAQENLTVA